MLRRAAVCSALALALATGCRGPERYERHFDSTVWKHALTRQGDDPSQWAPEVGLTALSAGLVYFDRDFSEDSPHHYLTGGNTTSGDVISLMLGFAPVVVGGVAWGAGDDGRAFEVASEALLLTGGATQLLKQTTNRRRPGRSKSNDSFPSGHVSFAAAGATLLARELEDGTGSRFGYLFFIPTLYVAIDRVEGERHWASDVAGGAALGILLANLVYNAHVPRGKHGERTIFERREHLSWSLAPEIEEDRLGLALTIDF